MVNGLWPCISASLYIKIQEHQFSPNWDFLLRKSWTIRDFTVARHSQIFLTRNNSKSCKFYFLFSQLSLIVGDENSISGIEEQSFLLGPNSLTAFISFSLSFLHWPIVVNNSLPLQGAWRHHIRRHWTESSAGGKNGSWKSKQEHRHSSVLWWGQHYWGTEHD